MGSVKKDLLKEIADKVQRKKDLKEEIAKRSVNVEAFVINMINDMESMLIDAADTDLAANLAGLYTMSFQERIKLIDVGAKLTVQWDYSDKEAKMPKVSGILITWSKEYQTKNNCEEQLFIDVFSLMLK